MINSLAGEVPRPAYTLSRPAALSIDRAHEKGRRCVVLVETAYPYTEEDVPGVHHLLGPDSLDPAYPATPKGQAAYMIDITQRVIDAGGSGVVYWAPDWIPAACTKARRDPPTGATPPGSIVTAAGRRCR